MLIPLAIVASLGPHNTTRHRQNNVIMTADNDRSCGTALSLTHNMQWCKGAFRNYALLYWDKWFTVVV